MYLSNKALGIAGILGAPFLFFEMWQSAGPGSPNTSLGSLFDLLYMIGWMCSVWGLLRLPSVQASRTVTTLLCIQLALLGVANVWNMWAIADPTNQSSAFRILDMFWPISNVFLFAVGVVIAIKNSIKGWRRYAVLFAGAWLPCTMIVGNLAGFSPVTFWVSGLHSVFAWAVMGWAVFSISEEEVQPLSDYQRRALLSH